jgi:Bacterial membrane protein YfhO
MRAAVLSAAWQIIPVMRSLGRYDATFLALGCVAVALAWAPLFVSDASLLVYQDASEQTYPWWVYSVREIQEGRFALWDPYTFGGRSHVGEGQVGTFYPPFILLSFLGSSWALTTTAIHSFAFLHAVLAFGGAYLLARVLGLGRLAAVGSGLTFALGGFFSSRALAQLNIFYGTAWIPIAVAGPFLAVRFAEPRWALLSGAALGLSVLAGHAQPALHAGLALGLILAFLAFARAFSDRQPLGVRRTAIFAILLIATAGASSAVQLLPMIEYQALALRWVGGSYPIGAADRIPYETIVANPSFHFENLPGIALRGVGRIEDGSIYVGIVAVALAAFGAVRGRASWRPLWLALLAIGLLLAMGDATPLLALVYSVIPFVDKVREPVRYLLLAHLALSVLVGLGLHQLADSGHRSPVLFAAAIGLVAIVAVELGGGWASSIPPRSGYDGVTSREAEQHYGGPLAQAVQSFLAVHPGAYRVQFGDGPIPRNLGLVIRVPSVTGYGATSPKKVFELRERLGFEAPSVGAALLGVRYVFTVRELDELQAVARAGSTIVYENPQALPPAWLVDSVQIAPDDDAAFDIMSAPGYDPGRTAVVTTAEHLSPRDLWSGSAGSVQITEYAPSVVRMSVHADRPVFLATSEPEYPGWTAVLDGRRVQTYRTNHAFRGLPLPAGEHTLDFRYEPRSVLLGGIISAAAGVAIVLAAMFSHLARLEGAIRRAATGGWRPLGRFTGRPA